MRAHKLASTALISLTLVLGLQALAFAQQGDPTISFFSGGNGGHADWLATSDQPGGDTDNQAIRLVTTSDPTFQTGYAGILFHHVSGIPAAAFPDSSFWVKTPDFAGPSLGSPRLVVAFQTAAGTYDGYADLRPLALGPAWQEVADPEDGGVDGWDVMNTLPDNPCYPFRYNQTWSQVQLCFAADTTLTVYMVADAYGIYHLIDDITVNGKHFSSASDNGNGNNDPAGPTATVDPSLLPEILILPTP